MDIRWLHTGHVVTGHYCTAQGIILSLLPFTFIKISFPRCNPSARGDKCRHDHPGAQIIIIIIETSTHAINTISKVIALHTLISVYWPKSTPSLLFAIIIMSLVWLYVILFVAIGIGLNGSKDYEIPTPVCTT
jgi:hypothetical protein